MNNTAVVFPEEVYSKYYNTAGNLVWVGVQSGEHLVILKDWEKENVDNQKDQ